MFPFGPLCPPRPLHNMSPGRVCGYGLEICIINTLLSPNKNHNVSASQLLYLWNATSASNGPQYAHNPGWCSWKEATERDEKAHNSFSCIQVWLMFSMSEGCKISTQNASIINTIYSLLFSVHCYCSGVSHAFHFLYTLFLQIGFIPAFLSKVVEHTLFRLDQ